MPSNKGGGGLSDHRRRLPARDGDDDDNPTEVLWVGNLSSDTLDPDIMAVFEKYGALDCNTMHGARSYSFVFFRSVDEAKAAKDALQGTPIHGSSVKIEFARPAKPVKHLWIGGINSSVTKEQLEDEFLKFGEIEEYQFLKERKSALIDYYKIEDAIAAQKNMNGKRLAGEQIRVDFVRSQPRRDGPDYHDSRNGYFSNRSLGPLERSMHPDGMGGFNDSSYHGSKRHMTHGGRRDGNPSNVLWIGYPPSVQIDEQMLHNAMILFGEIERVKCFPSRHYSFVEFRSTDEARRAKEGLQGRLFNDPRIQILFSHSELAPTKDNPPPFPAFRGPRPDMFYNEGPFGPLEFLGPGRPMAPNSFPGPVPPNVPGPNLLMRPFGPQGFDPCHGGPEFHDIGQPPNWKRRSPSAPGILPSPPGMRPAFRPMSGAWDGFDMREAKRSRMDGSSADDSLFLGKRVDEGVGDFFGFSHPDRAVSGQSHHSPVVRGHGGSRGSPDVDYSWRGIIAKGGTHVCYARCVPIGRGIDSPLPGTVNCSARTGLDMLTKHYADAIGFDIVFFLPDSEEDFAAYTEFLRYLGTRNRAGVAKLDDGTTLFLVPPSEFLTKVLNVSGPERLYGVVLKMPQQSTSAAAQQPQLAIPPTPSNYSDWQQEPNLQKGYNIVPQNEDQALKMAYSRSLHREPGFHAGVGKSLFSHADEPRSAQTASLDHSGNPAAASQVEVSLTPELIATLASLIPNKGQASASGTVQMPSSSNARPAGSSSSVMHDGSMPFQGWRQEHQATVSGTSLEQPNNVPQQLGQQLNSQTPLISQFPAYNNTPSGPDHSAQAVIGGTQIQNPGLNMAQAPAIPGRPYNNYAMQSQGGQFSAPQSNQHYQFDPSPSHNNYGMVLPTAATAVNPAGQQQLNRSSLAAHDHSASLPQPQTVIPLPTDRAGIELPTQGQQLQNVLSGSAQGTSDGDVDKNQRYQSTLQFAASLLLQIQQQQAGSQAAQGSGNQQ